MVWVRRSIIVFATVVSLAFAGDNTSARVRRIDSADAGPLAVFSVADRVPVHFIRDGLGVGLLRSLPDPLLDVISLAAAGLCLLGIGRRLSRQQLDGPQQASTSPAETEGGRS